MRYHVTVGDRTFVVDVEPGGVQVNGESVSAELRPIRATGAHGLFLGGATHRVVARGGSAGRWQLMVDGRPLEADVVDERTRAIRRMTAARGAAAGPRPLRAPMPGLVVKVEVAEGDAVAEGQGLVIVEAMKMENELRAEAPARVRRVLVEPGQTVEKDQVLLELAPPEAEDGGEQP